MSGTIEAGGQRGSWDGIGAAAVPAAVQVGEAATRVMREAIVEPDLREAQKAARAAAFYEADAFAAGLIALAGPYDDVRAIETLRRWISDRVRETQTPSYDGESDAAP